MTHLPIRFPYAPLEAAAGYPSSKQLAARCQVSSRTIFRWKKNGLTWTQADDAATRLGAHPAIIWSHWWSAMSEFDTADCP